MENITHITTNHPIEKDGRTYGYFGINLATSPMWRESDVGCSVAMRLTPYAEDASGVDRLDDDAKAVVYGDAFTEAQNDPDLAECVSSIMSALQKFINAKNL